MDAQGLCPFSAKERGSIAQMFSDIGLAVLFVMCFRTLIIYVLAYFRVKKLPQRGWPFHKTASAGAWGASFVTFTYR